MNGIQFRAIRKYSLNILRSFANPFGVPALSISFALSLAHRISCHYMMFGYDRDNLNDIQVVKENVVRYSSNGYVYQIMHQPIILYQKTKAITGSLEARTKQCEQNEKWKGECVRWHSIRVFKHFREMSL